MIYSNWVIPSFQINSFKESLLYIQSVIAYFKFYGDIQEYLNSSIFEKFTVFLIQCCSFYFTKKIVKIQTTFNGFFFNRKLLQNQIIEKKMPLRPKYVSFHEKFKFKLLTVLEVFV